MLLAAGCTPPAQPVAEGGLPSPAVPAAAPTLVRETIAGVVGPLVELHAEVRGHTKFYGYIPINPITTIIRAYMAAHPDRSLKEATAAAKKFLALSIPLRVY